MRRVARIAECLEDRQIDAVRAVGHDALPAAWSSRRRAIPHEREEGIGCAVAWNEVLVVREVQRLAGRDIDHLHLQIRDLMKRPLRQSLPSGLRIDCGSEPMTRPPKHDVLLVELREPVVFVPESERSR